MDSLFERRYSAARRLMAQLDIDLLLVNNRENLIYFTGLTDIECLAILIPREAPPCAVTLWLDVEFVRQKTGLDTYGYSFPKGNLAATVIERIKAYGMEQPTIGFERYFVGFSVMMPYGRYFRKPNSPMRQTCFIASGPSRSQLNYTTCDKRARLLPKEWKQRSERLSEG